MWPHDIIPEILLLSFNHQSNGQNNVTHINNNLIKLIVNRMVKIFLFVIDSYSDAPNSWKQPKNKDARILIWDF